MLSCTDSARLAVRYFFMSGLQSIAQRLAGEARAIISRREQTGVIAGRKTKCFGATLWAKHQPQRRRIRCCSG